MADDITNIIIISEQSLRAKIIRGIIENDLKDKVQVSIFPSYQIDPVKKFTGMVILLLDLMGTDLPSKKIILPIKEQEADIKIIALHMYRSPNLVDPLFNMGIDGYVYYEPTREELINAIRTVTSGEQYIPNYIA